MSYCILEIGMECKDILELKNRGISYVVCIGTCNQQNILRVIRERCDEEGFDENQLQVQPYTQTNYLFVNSVEEYALLGSNIYYCVLQC